MNCYLNLAWITYGTCIIILGLTGNILSIFVLRRSTMKYLGISKYLILLSFSDFVICASGTTIMWTDVVFGINVRSFDKYFCKISVYVNRIFMVYSSWILLVISVDRLDHVFFPLKITRSKRLSLKLGIPFFVIAIWQSYTLYFYEVISNPVDLQLAKASCRISDRNKKVSEAVLRLASLIFTTFYSVIPCIILTICNIAIVCKLNIPTQLNLGENAINGRKRVSIRLMVLLSILFIVTTGPFGIMIVVQTFLQLKSQCLIGHLSLLALTNNSVNVLLYVFSGKRFRQELVKLLKRKQSSPSKGKKGSRELSVVNQF